MKEHLMDTAVEAVDDDPMMSPDGYATMTPAFDEAETLDSLEEPDNTEPQAELSEQEAYETMKYMAPLSLEEQEILAETPFLDPKMRWVDDPDHTEYLLQKMKARQNGMDEVLEDSMYGNLSEEEQIERAGTDSGFSLRPKRLFRGVRRAAGSAARRAGSVAKNVGKLGLKIGRLHLKVATWPTRKLAAVAKAVASAAATPIKRAIRPAINNTAMVLAKKGGRARPSRADFAAANKIAISSMLRHRNPLVKFGGRVLGFVGTGVSGIYGPGHILSINNEASEVGFTGVEIAALATATAAAIAASLVGLKVMMSSQAAAGGPPPGAPSEQEQEQEPGTEAEAQEQPSASEEEQMTDESGKLYRSIQDPLADFSGEDDEFSMVLGDAEDSESDQFSMVLGNSSLRVLGSDSTLGDFTTEILGDNPTEILGGSEVESGQWLHKLNPMYWTKSARQRHFIDAGKKAEEDKRKNIKYSAQRRGELEEGERALTAKQAAQSATQESSELEARLKDIEAQVSGMGEDAPPAAAAAVHEGVAVATRTKSASSALLAKLEAGEKLSPEEVAVLKRCLKNCALLSKLHANLHAGMSGTVGYHDERGARGTFLGAAPSLKKNDWIKLIAVATGNPKKLGLYLQQNKWQLSQGQKVHLANMTKLARRGMAKKMAASKLSGNDDLIGLTWGKALAVATLPVAALAYGTYKGAQYAKRKIFGSKSKQTPAQARQARIIAARKRRFAAMKKEQAALAATDAERQALEEEAQAAESEASAQEAETESQAPGEAPEDEAESEGMGHMKTSKVYEMGDFVGDFVGAMPDGKAKKIVTEAAKNTPMGMKIRAGATLYRAAKKNNPKARLAIAKMQKKAKGGDHQAQRDLNAVKAGKIAVHAKNSAISRKAKAEARNRQGVAIRKRLESGAGDRLARMSRKRQLAKVAHIERQAARGDRKAKARIAAAVARAHSGDKKAMTAVAALKVSRNIRLAAKNPREARNLVAAGKLVARARKGNRTAIKQIRIVEAAAKKGQPNAKRAHERLKVAAAAERAIATGKVVAPKSGAVAEAEARKRYLRLKKKVSAGVATREEALAAAKMANRLGDKKEAGVLALQARSLRSATTGIKNAATVAASAQTGNPAAQKVINETLERAAKGDPSGINSAGNLAAVQALDNAKRGLPMSPEMAEATGLVERARAGDPEAKRIAERVGVAAQTGDSKAVEAAVALTAASAILAATAAKPTAQKEWRDKATEARGQKLDTNEAVKANEEFAGLYAKVQHGTATQGEARRARDLAMALGKPRLAAEVSALMPPIDTGAVLSSMPGAPLPAIRSLGGAFKEGVRALLLATSDPIANYREGIRSRGSNYAHQTTLRATPLFRPSKKT